MQKMCVFTKFPHQKIMWNFGILCGVGTSPVDTRRLFNAHKTSIRGRRCRIDIETMSCVYWKNLVRFLSLCWITGGHTIHPPTYRLVSRSDLQMLHLMVIAGLNLQKKTAATSGVLWKKLFLKVSQNSQENTCARSSFLIKLQTESCNFIKKETLAHVLSYEFCKNFKNTFFRASRPKCSKDNFWLYPLRNF